MNGTSVDLQCVNSGFPRPEIVFFNETEQIMPGQGHFTRYEQVSFDTVRLSGVRKEDSGNYVCEARRDGVELDRSLPGRLLVCSKCSYKLVSYSPGYLYSNWHGSSTQLCLP